MSRQVDKKYTDLDSKFAKVLEISGYKKQADFAMECKINPGTLSKAIERSSLSDDIVDKIYDRFGVRREFWDDGKEPIVAENGTPAMKLTDNKGNFNHEEALKDLIQSNDRYHLVPTIILTDYEILSKNEIRSRETTQQEMINLAKEISATKQVVIDEKNKLIAELEEEIRELEKQLDKLRSAAPAQKT
jgi:hypothetical protein